MFSRFEDFLQKFHSAMTVEPFSEWLPLVSSADRLIEVLQNNELDSVSWNGIEKIWEKKEEHLRFLSALSTASPNVPQEILEKCSQDNQIEFLNQFEKFMEASEEKSISEWEAGLALWNHCRDVAWKSSSCQFMAVDLQHPQLNSYLELVKKKDLLQETPPHRWFAALRGEKEGVLYFRWEHPTEAFSSQIDLARKKWPFVLPKRKNDSLFEELVLPFLEKTLKHLLFVQSERFMLSAGANTYRNLLEIEPLTSSTSVASIFLMGRKKPAGFVVVDATGKLVDSIEFEGNNNLLHNGKSWLEQHSIENVLLPINATHTQTLQQFVRELGKSYTIHRIREAGMQKARKELQEEFNLEDSVCSAWVLAKRALFPNQEWMKCDPLELGLIEYVELLPEDKVRSYLGLEPLLIEKGIRRQALEKIEKKPSLHSIKSGLNPLIKSIRDLKEGLEMDGIVSNLTNFGAFVQFGLEQEGLVHLSELCDRFVRHPSEVVHSGQKVKVRVLSVDYQSGRISLTMKVHGNSPKKSSGNNQDQRVQRKQSLQALENLFKDK